MPLGSSRQLIALVALVTTCSRFAAAQTPPETAAVSSSPERTLAFSASDSRATLEHFDSAADRWHEVCSQTCQISASIGEAYRVAGDGISRSPRFEVSPGRGPLTVHAAAGSRAGKTTGVVLTSVGGGLTAVGGILVMGTMVICADCYDIGTKVAAASMFLGGGALLTAGILMIASNRTRLTIDDVVVWSRLPLGRGVALTPSGLSF